MKLFLSSLAISETQGAAFTKLVGKEPHDTTLAHIENAADLYDPNAAWIESHRAEIQSHGYNVEAVDLRDYLSDRAGLREKLASKDVIWLGGGNVYYLRWILRESGADQIIKELVTRGTVYGGGSAGAIVAGPTVDYFQKADDPSHAPELILEGLNLTDTVVVPHSDSTKYGTVMAEIAQRLQEGGYSAAVLDDSQALIIDGEQKTVL